MKIRTSGLIGLQFLPPSAWEWYYPYCAELHMAKSMAPILIADRLAKTTSTNKNSIEVAWGQTIQSSQKATVGEALGRIFLL